MYYLDVITHCELTNAVVVCCQGHMASYSRMKADRISRLSDLLAGRLIEQVILHGM